MSSLPPIPPAIAAAAGAVGSRDSQAGETSQSSSTGGQTQAVEASAEGSDRDADGRDLREHKRRPNQESLDEAIEEATGAEERGGLDVSV